MAMLGFNGIISTRSQPIPSKLHLLVSCDEFIELSYF